MYKITTNREYDRTIDMLVPREDGTGDEKTKLKVRLRHISESERKACPDNEDLVRKTLVRGYDLVDLDGNEIPENLGVEALLEDALAVTAIAREVVEVTSIKNFRKVD